MSKSLHLNSAAPVALALLLLSTSQVTAQDWMGGRRCWRKLVFARLLCGWNQVDSSESGGLDLHLNRFRDDVARYRAATRRLDWRRRFSRWRQIRGGVQR